MIDKTKMTKWWLASANRNWRAAKSLFQLGHYEMCLFCCHLALEKYLKAFVVLKSGKEAPYIHNLNRLAEAAGLKLTNEQKVVLAEITSFNIQARYGAEKLTFYKRATKAFAKEYVNQSHKLLLWLKGQFPRE